jgi:hypothetical protein
MNKRLGDVLEQRKLEQKTKGERDGHLENMANQDSGSFGLEVANNLSANDNDVQSPLAKRRRLEIEDDINEQDNRKQF